MPIDNEIMGELVSLEMDNIILEDSISKECVLLLEKYWKDWLVNGNWIYEGGADREHFLAIGFHKNKWRTAFYCDGFVRWMKNPLGNLFCRVATLPIHQIPNIDDLKLILEELKLTDIREDKYIEERLKEGK